MRLGPPPGQVSRPFWLLALLIGSATVGMHVFVPALPLLGKEFGVDAGRTQLTISLYMIVIAAGQIVYGPLSDRFGRRPVLVVAMMLFIAAGIGVALASSFEMVLVARLLQAAGGCAGLVLGRAVVADTAKGNEAASTIAAVNAVLLISPTIAPIVGVWLAGTFGWRAIPLLLVLLGTATLIGVLLRLSETSGARPEPIGEVAAKYRKLLTSRRFLVQVLGGSLTTTTMFTLLASSPFVVIGLLHRSLEEAGWFYAIFVIGLLAGNVTAGRILKVLAFDTVFVLATLTGTLGASIFLVALLTHTLTAPVFMAAGFLYTAMAGNMAPLTLTRAVGLAPDLRGTATGIFGASQFSAGAIGVTVASASTDMALASAIVLLVCAGSGLVLYSALRLSALRRA